MNKFNLVKKGYDPEQVDKRIKELETIINEYHEKDGAIANAILNAQLAADEILRKANAAAETIVQNARNMSAQLTESSSRQIESVISSVKEQKAKLAVFRDDYTALLEKYLLALDDSDIAHAQRKAEELETYLERFVEKDAEAEKVKPE